MAGKEDWLDETHFDAVVIGTGITESVVAAALSRSGRRVLHLDSLPFYGSSSATLQLSGFRDWLCRLSLDKSSSNAENAKSEKAGRSPWDLTEADVDEEAVAIAKSVAEGLSFERDCMNRPVLHDGIGRCIFRPCAAVRAEVLPATFSSVSFEERIEPIAPQPAQPTQATSSPADPGNETAAPTEGISDEPADAGDAEPDSSKLEESITQAEGWEQLLERGRDYNLDFTPKLNLSSGKLVEALLQSGVGRYLEFMPLKSTFIHVPSKAGGEADGALERVPMSKAEIFQASNITPMEKRLLMKFLQTCLSLAGVAEAKDGGWAIQGVGGSEKEQLGFTK
eukprot:CAMPEP_0181296666 /NCGR_PEP_ID=MMETSP1101-20121128/4826_1 /TAXON_ID=46948 /ORGANISM="Rhodomonas abbreviata, Strain Caron Lab Isolate" /LENGTH=337 /DNA_ID=CAMNT_0023401547 /DNA_START=33 /DNA_END=1043 /DNA_ORIENTATION=-